MTAKEDKYLKIINAICETKGISIENLYKILKDRDCKYLFFLLLKKYRCENVDIINNYFSEDIKKHIKYNIKRAEEKLLINRGFREMYFEVDKVINGEIG